MALYINGVGQDTFAMNGVSVDNLYVDGVLVWTSVAEVPRYELEEALVDSSTVDDSANTSPAYNGLLTESDGTTPYEPTALQYLGNGLLELDNGRIMDTQYAKGERVAAYGIYDADGSSVYKIWYIEWDFDDHYDIWEGDQDTPIRLTEYAHQIPETVESWKVTDGRPSWLPPLDELPTPDMLFSFEDNLLDTTGTYSVIASAGISYGVGTVNRCLIANGTTTYVSHDLTGSPLRTVAVWARPDTLKTRNFISVWDDTSSIYIDNQAVVATAHTPTQALSQSSNSSITIGEWVHIVALFTDDSTIPTLYVNGVLQTVQEHNDFWTIGTGINSIASISTYFFEGAIDEHSVYLRHLTQEEITALYNQGSPA